MHRIVSCCAVSVVLLSVACLPIPTSFQATPRLVGFFRTPAGEPLPLQAVALSRDSTCAEPRAIAISDSSGRFSFQPTRHRSQFVLLLPFDRAAAPYTVCGTVGARWVPIAHGLSFTQKQTDTMTCQRPDGESAYFPTCTAPQ